MARRADIRAGRAYVELSVRRSGFDRGLRAAQGQLRAFSTGIQTIGSELLRFGATAGGIFGGFVGAAIGPINAANTLAKAIKRFEKIFGDSAAATRAWARDYVDAIGRAEGDTLASLSTFGGFFKGLKVGSDEAAEMAKQMHTLALDFGTFNALSDDESISRFISALSGSSEVLDRFGINIKVAALDQALIARGFEESAKGATELQKVVARMDIIRSTLGSQGAIGSASAASDTYSGRLAALNSRLGNLAETIGGVLLPPVTELIRVFERGIHAAELWVAANPEVVSGAGKLAVAFGIAGAATISTGLATIIYGRALGKVSSGVGFFRGLLRSGAKQLDIVRNGAIQGAKAAIAFSARWSSAGAQGASAVGTLAAAISGRLASSLTLAAREATRLVTGADFRSLANNVRRGVAAIPGILRSAFNPQVAKLLARTLIFDFESLFAAFPGIQSRLKTGLNLLTFAANASLNLLTSRVRAALDNTINAMRSKAGVLGDALTGGMRTLSFGASVILGDLKTRMATALAPVGAIVRRAFAPVSRVAAVWRKDAALMLQVGRSTFRLLGQAWSAVWPRVAKGFVNVMRGAFNQVKAMGLATGRAIATGLRGSLGRGLGAATGAVGGLGALVGTLGTGAAAGLAMMLTTIPLLIGTITSLGSAFLFLLSPIGLVAAAVVGGGIMWTRYSEAGRRAMETIRNAFAPMVANMRTVIGGIRDALMGGDLGLAAQIAWKGVQIAFARGMAALTDFFHAVMSGDFKAALASGMSAFPAEFGGIINTIVGMFGSLVDRLAAMWAAFSEGFVKMWTGAVTSVVGIWSSSVDSIANKILEQAAQGGVVGAAISKMLGVDLSQEQAKRELLHRKQAALAQRELASAQDAAREAEQSGDADALAFAQRRIKNAEASLANANNVPDLLSEAQADVARQMEDRTKSIRDELARLRSEAEKRTRIAFDNVPESGSDREARADRIAALEAELQALRDRAANLAKREKGKLGGPPEAGGSGAASAATPTAGARASVATFSGAALVALGQSAGSGSPQDEMKKTWAEQRRFLITERRERQKEAAAMQKMIAQAIAAMMYG